MWRTLINILTAIFIVLFFTTMAQPANAEYFRVTSVYDGDTFQIQIPHMPAALSHLKWHIRVRGMDTPEIRMNAKCRDEAILGELARTFAEDLIRDSNYLVNLSNIKHDKYGGRFDADVEVMQGSFASLMKQAGLAREYHGGKRKGWCDE